MKKLLNKKGMTLLETVIAIAILAAIALPLLNVFVYSAKADETARAVLNANYISQNYTEKLETVTYQQALSSTPYKQEFEGYYLTAKIQPYGSVTDSTHSQVSYSNIIIYGDGSMLAVMPDGQWATFSSVPSSISFAKFNSSYTFQAGTTTLTGSLEHSFCIVTINAMKQSDVFSMNVYTTEEFKPLLYCKSPYKDNYNFDSVYEVIEDLLVQDSTLVHVTTYVYEDSLSTKAVSSLESYITIKNWE